MFERKILYSIYGPIQDKGQWRGRYNKELHNLFEESKLIIITTARLRWAGHVGRINEKALPKRTMHMNPTGQRKTGRPKARRIDIAQGARTLGIKSWWPTAMNKKEGRQLLRKTKTFTEL